jgi:hypothetical protein
MSEHSIIDLNKYPDDTLISIGAACDWLRVSARTLQGWGVKAAPLPKRPIHFLVSDLKAVLRGEKAA